MLFLAHKVSGSLNLSQTHSVRLMTFQACRLLVVVLYLVGTIIALVIMDSGGDRLFPLLPLTLWSSSESRLKAVYDKNILHVGPHITCKLYQHFCSEKLFRNVSALQLKYMYKKRQLFVACTCNQILKICHLWNE